MYECILRVFMDVELQLYKKLSGLIRSPAEMRLFSFKCQVFYTGWLYTTSANYYVV